MKTREVRFDVSEEFFGFICKLAKEAGTSPASFMRNSLYKYLKETYTKQDDRPRKRTSRTS